MQVISAIYRVIRRPVKLALHAVAALLGVGVIAFGLLVWRAASGPITIDGLAPMLATMLADPASGTSAAIGHAQLVWDKDASALRLVAGDAQIFDREHRLIAAVPQLSLGLNFAGPTAAPIEIFAHDFTLHLARAADGSFHFGGLALTQAPDPAAPVGPPVAPQPGDPAGDDVRAFLLMQSGWGGLGKVGVIRLAKVTATVDDVRLRQTWDIEIPQLLLRRSRKDMQASGSLTVKLGGLTSSMQVEAAYRRDEHSLALRAQFAALNPAAWAGVDPALARLAALDMPLSGAVEARYDERMALQGVAVDLAGANGTVTASHIWPQPLAVTALKLRGRLDEAAHRLTLDQAALDLGGVKIAIQATGAPRAADDSKSIALQATATISDWPLDRVAAIWPPSLAPNPRAWITENMSKGRFTELKAQVGLVMDWNAPDTARDIDLKAGLAMTGATIAYLKGMPPATEVEATGTADQKEMRILVKSGKAERLALGASPVTIGGLDGEVQTLAMQLTGQNKVADVVRFIDHEPLHYARALGLKPEDVSGDAALDVKLSFPLLKELPLETIDIDARAKITGLASAKLVKALPIADGAFDLMVDAKHLELQGKALFKTVPFAASYRQAFSAPATGAAQTVESEAILTGTLQPADWQALGLDMAAMLKGPSGVKLRYGRNFGSPAALDLDADFAEAALQAPMLGWTKQAGQPATGKARLVFGGAQVRLAEFALTGPQLKIAATGALDAATMQPQSLVCSQCRVGRNDVALKLGFANGKVAQANVTGAALDIRDEDDAKPPEKTETSPLDAKIDVKKFYRGEQYFTAVKADMQRDRLGWTHIDLKALAGGKVPVTAALMHQDDGLRHFQIATDDLGAVLRAADMTTEVEGGKLRVEGISSAEAPRRIKGSLKLTDYRVRKLPFLAVILSAGSFTGFANMLSGGSGIKFDRLEGGYVWQGDMLELEDVRTAGGGLGLNVEGKIDFAASQADLRGTVVPFSFVNRALGVIPVIGNLLTGGEGGGVFAVSYTAKGDLGKLAVNVNPVSILAPGILRRLFFEGD